MHHELSLAEKVKLFLENSFEPDDISKVRRIVIGIGKMVMADKENIRQAFDLVKKDTDFAHVEIDFVVDELRFRCRECGKEFSSIDYETHCPECGGTVRVLSGDDICICEVIKE